MDDYKRRKLSELTAFMLLEHGGMLAPRNGPYELASRNKSPIYFDNRLLATPAGDSLIITGYAMDVLDDIEEKNSIDVVAGGETAGIAPSKDLARMTGKDFIYVRKKPKGHGAGAQVEGVIKPDQCALLYEDLITSGGSKINFIDGLRRAGYEVNDCLVIFDRQQGGGGRLKEECGVQLYSLTDMDTALRVAEDSSFFEAWELDEIYQYFEDEKTWHEAKGLEYYG